MKVMAGEKIGGTHEASRVLSNVGCGHHCTDEDLHYQHSQTKLKDVSFFSHWAVF